MLDRERRDAERDEKGEQLHLSLERLRAIEEDLMKREQQLREREQEVMRRGRPPSPERFFRGGRRSPPRYDDRFRPNDERCASYFI